MITYPNEKPISNNRNKIVQNFLLQKEFDYLLMIDSDIIPPRNILNLADFQKDIISAVCFMYQQDMVAPLILMRQKEGQYGIANFKGYEGLIEVDAVGTGCLMLSRKVLEDIPAPFADVFDKHGVRKYGLDLAFCQKAKAKGYKIYCHLDYVAEHYVKIGLQRVYGALTRQYGF
jgi:GT2 family glycosyltransferase